MTLTRANVEQIIVKRCGALMTAAGLDGTSINGENADLNDALASAIRRAGGTVASISSVSDSDLNGFAETDYDKLFDLAEWRALESIAGNLDDVNIQVGPRREDLADLSVRVDRKLERLTKKIEAVYGIGAPRVFTSTLNRNDGYALNANASGGGDA